jgi:phosphopantetheinyl transferase
LIIAVVVIGVDVERCRPFVGVDWIAGLFEGIASVCRGDRRRRFGRVRPDETAP